MMTPLKIADEMESFARDGVRPDDALLRDWAKHLRSYDADGDTKRDAALEEAAKVCDGYADRSREVWESYVAKCRENPNNIGGGSQSWHQYYEQCAAAIRAIKRSADIGKP